MSPTSGKPAILDGKPIFDSRIPFVRPSLPNYAELEPRIRRAIESGMLTKGGILQEFETAAAEHLRAKHAVAVSSCTSGLMLAYQALGLTGEVIVPSFTFMATISALVWNGLTPRYVEVDSGTTNLDVAEIEAKISPATSAIVAVHNFGNPAQIAELESVAKRHSLRLIFDSAHGFGTLYRGAPVGAQGDIHVFSLSPTKLLVAGEGGIVATNHDDLAQRIRLAREYGNDGTYDSLFAGMNARMPEISALLALSGLELLEKTAQFRNHVADRYRQALQDLPGIEFQTIHPEDRSSYKDFSVVIEKSAFGLSRDEVVEALRAENIDTRNYYDPPAHRQTAYQQYFRPEEPLQRTDALANNSMSLPIGAQIDEPAVAKIGQAMCRIYDHRESVRRKMERNPVNAMQTVN